MQVLDQILLRLAEPQKSRKHALVCGRLGFLEWLVSIPEDCDLCEEARLAHERAAPLKLSMPAIGVLCELLTEARTSPELGPMLSSGRVRRRGSRQRRSLH